jgi:hypothetical protein
MPTLDHVSPEFRALWFVELWPLLMGHPKVRVAYPDDAAAALGGEMYCAVLDGTPPAVLRAAVYQCLARCEWFPAPAEILAAAEGLTRPAEPTGAEVYGQVLAECSRALAETRIPQLDPIAKECVKTMGGAYTLVYSQSGTSDRARFAEMYEQKRAAERAEGEVVPIARLALERGTAHRRLS